MRTMEDCLAQMERSNVHLAKGIMVALKLQDRRSGLLSTPLSWTPDEDLKG